MIYIIVAKRKKERGGKMKNKKYKELFKLKGLMRERKISYNELSKLIGINVTTF